MAWRKENGQPRKWLAERLGVSAKTVESREYETRNPSGPAILLLEQLMTKIQHKKRQTVNSAAATYMIQETLSISQLGQYLSKAAWILKEPIGASEFKAYIFPMLFFKRICDVYRNTLKPSPRAMAMATRITPATRSSTDL